MEDYQSKYTGEQVESLLDMVANGEAGGGGGIAVETDPIFSASPAASITDAKKAEWDGKQDAIADLATIRSGAEKGATALQEHQDISGKQDVITDLATIREGASKGATALQSIPEEYVTESELSAKGYATTAQLDGKVDKVDGKQLSAEDFTSALKNKLESLYNYDDTELSNAVSTLRGDFDKLVSGDTTTAIKTFNEVIAFLDGIQDTQDLASIVASIEQQIAGKMDKVTLATVATSGSYNDLSNKPTIPAEQVNADWNATSGKAQILNKPTIPSAVTESTVSGWGFTKNTGTYSKPSGGIPKSDLASAVQTSLGKADTALQSYTEQYKGTITGVSANGTSVATSGVANIPAASTSAYGVTKLSSATNSTSTTLAATASAVKSAYDLANGKQDKLVSGTNIKTVNGESILGSGDITISGGSDANVQAVDTGDVLDDVNVEYATTAYVDNKVANISLTDYATIAYVDGLVGDINSVLESIIGGGGGSNEITFYIDDGVYVTPMKALPNMTWEDFVNSEYANQNSMLTNFSLVSYSSYNAVQLYHEEATQGLMLYKDGMDGISDNVKDSEVIEDGKTYYAH